MHTVARTLLLSALASLAFAENSPHLANLRQITDGGQNAESYWSPDGQRLVFQSTRDGRTCDQIYVMNRDGSGVKMVSTGKGRTTCGYFLGDGKRIIYASTHEGGDSCPPPADRSKGYVWPIYGTYDLFVTDLGGAPPKQLTNSKGYDAEATVNWKTGRVVYTSLAGGDLDLWSMKSDGSDKRQLTRETGYDGGAVFSPDGKKLVWRAMHPKGDALAAYKDLLSRDLVSPMKMEIFIGAANGRNARAITHFGCASFAPTFTPDGKKILFASNKLKCDSHNFELFLMNLDGSGLEQVTDFGGFTSFPEFSPDGKRLAFTSSYQAKGRYEFNIFVADWK